MGMSLQISRVVSQTNNIGAEYSATSLHVECSRSWIQLSVSRQHWNAHQRIKTAKMKKLKIKGKANKRTNHAPVNKETNNNYIAYTMLYFEKF